MSRKPLVSIITPVLNAEETLEETIKSVLDQTYNNIEYIVVDNMSNDSTPEIIKRHKDSIAKILSECKRGIYTTINKGLESSSGEIIGILNADDIYAGKNVVDTTVQAMVEKKVDACWGGLVYVNRQNCDKITRYWKPSDCNSHKFQNGWILPHPTFFVKRKIYEKYGLFNTDFKISADYELMLRLLYKNKISHTYVSNILIKMREGGMSNRGISNILAKTKEDLKACRMYGLGVYTVFKKNVSKVPQFFVRKTPF